MAARRVDEDDVYNVFEEAEDDALAALVDEINDYIRTHPSAAFMLTDPQTLTVRKSDGNYSKQAHVGGEEFKIEGVYSGKKGSLIYVFKPVATARYIEMEMTEAQGKKLLTNFDQYIKQIGGWEMSKTKEDALKANALKIEREKNAGKSAQYAELGFGDW